MDRVGKSNCEAILRIIIMLTIGIFFSCDSNKDFNFIELNEISIEVLNNLSVDTNIKVTKTYSDNFNLKPQFSKINKNFYPRHYTGDPSLLLKRLNILGFHGIRLKDGTIYFMVDGFLDRRCVVFENTQNQLFFWSFGKIISKEIIKLDGAWEYHCGNG